MQFNSRKEGDNANNYETKQEQSWPKTSCMYKIKTKTNEKNKTK